MDEHLYLSLKVVQEAPADSQIGKKEAVSREIMGERVRQARIAARLTQQELAGETYSKSYISAVERGKMTPSFQALRTLAERLNRPLSFFFGEGELDLEGWAGSAASASGFSEEEQQQREEEARAMLVQAEGLLARNQTDQAEKVLEALNVAANEPPAALPLSERPRWYWLAGWAGVWAHRFPEAIGWLERGLEVAGAARAKAPPSQKARMAEMAERIRYFLGVCYYELAQPAQAREQHLRCLTAISDGVVTDPELTFLIYKALGNDNIALGRHEEAVLYYQRACQKAEDLNDPRQRGLAYWGLGQTYKSSGDLFHAEAAFREALNTFERLDNMQLASQLHAMLGQVLTELKSYEKAERHFRLALESAERINDVYARGIALGGLATLRLEQGNPDEAITAALEGSGALRQSESYQTEGQVYQTLAEAYEARGNSSAAEQAYKDAIITLARTEADEYLSRVHERYGQFLAAQGHFAEAYEQMGLAQKVLARKKATQQ